MEEKVKTITNFDPEAVKEGLDGVFKAFTTGINGYVQQVSDMSYFNGYQRGNLDGHINSLEKVIQMTNLEDITIETLRSSISNVLDTIKEQAGVLSNEKKEEPKPEENIEKVEGEVVQN